jgi:hypothetical protein
MMALNPGRCTRGAVWFVPEGSARGVLVLNEGLLDAAVVALLMGASDPPLSPDADA